MPVNRILIWGTGNIANRTLKNAPGLNVIGFIESNPTVDIYDGKPVYRPDILPGDYDYIIVANTHSSEIAVLCDTLQIPAERLIFLFGVKKQLGLSDARKIREVIGDINFEIYCAEYGLIEDSFVINDADVYTDKNRRKNFEIDRRYFWPIIHDKYEEAGQINNYFLQDLWAAKKIIERKPGNHFDIGSRIDGFIAHILAAGISVKMIDIRPFPVEVEGLSTIVDDATELGQIEDDSIESFSALCSLEHFGLGRYGDPIDPEACFKCLSNIQRKIKKGGYLYLAIPIGKERVEFNAHRVFFAQTIVDCLKDLSLVEYSCAAEKRIEQEVPIHKYDDDPHNGEYRYGLFEFRK